MNYIKTKLVPYWRSAWRLWSVRIAGIGAIFWTYALAFPDAAIQVWQALPGEIKSVFVPSKLSGYVSLVLFVLTIISRITHQPKAAAVIEQKLEEKKL
jgi:hypothetical protein